MNGKALDNVDYDAGEIFRSVPDAGTNSLSLTGFCVVLRMARLTDDADDDATEKSGNVPRPSSEYRNYHAYYGLGIRFVTLVLLNNMIMLRRQGQVTTI
ncbi:unnamed protein product [Protopolystoma xenopodis]|uniref:Uncharacterized protein n=1 Tax=Protopolystoma xenopodis TaxID=117903 RepID=A0A3S5ARX7_9PLAT|nr:unnamed protein product [Protopolystoma xenopodis]